MQLDGVEKVRLESEYLNKSEEYYRFLHHEVTEEDFDDEKLDDMREEHMSRLNRLQKMKNRHNYKKEKHRVALHDRREWE
jgi:hypothetical protein